MKTPLWQVIEETCDVCLPLAYRALLATYPPRLLSARYFTHAPEQGGPSSFELLADPKQIIELNQRERESWPKAEYSEVPLPDSYFFIGHDGGGNLFAIDTATIDGCPVFEFDHEEKEWQQRAESLEEFVEMLVSSANQDAM